LSPFSRKDLIAIAIVVDIAIHGGDQPVRSKDITSRHNFRARELEPVLHALTRNGILASRSGSRGGYELIGSNLSLISADDVIRAARGTESVRPKARSEIAARVVMPAIGEAEKALSEAMQCITILQLVRSAEKL
jgi:Rrf2 family protein